jgi:hypothetical protein
MENMEIVNLEFIEWIGGNHFQKIDIYSVYKRGEGGFRYEITPDYDTLVDTRWTRFADEIPSIMVDNDNSELDWIMKNSYTTEELYKLFKNE